MFQTHRTAFQSLVMPSSIWEQRIQTPCRAFLPLPPSKVSGEKRGWWRLPAAVPAGCPARSLLTERRSSLARCWVSHSVTSTHASTDTQSHFMSRNTGLGYGHLKLCCQLLGNAKSKMLTEKCSLLFTPQLLLPPPLPLSPKIRWAKKCQKLPTSTFCLPKLLWGFVAERYWGL